LTSAKNANGFPTDRIVTPIAVIVATKILTSRTRDEMTALARIRQRLTRPLALLAVPPTLDEFIKLFKTMSVEEMALPDKDRPIFPMAGIGRAILLGRLFLSPIPCSSANRDKGKGRPRRSKPFVSIE
jgi:hypothetical protein